MARWITCDEVFDVLTQGPFPTGDIEQDADVELHLTGCHECRQLAEGLRPAVELLQEAMVEGDEGLPAYRGRLPRLTTPATLTVDYPATTLTSQLQPSKDALAHPITKPDVKSIFIAHVARIAAACLLILLMIGTIPLIAALRGPTPAQLRSQLGTAALPDVCRVAFQTPDPTAVSEGCCARCHHPAASKEPSGETVGEHPASSTVESLVSHSSELVRTRLLAQSSLNLIAKSCQACHE